MKKKQWIPVAMAAMMTLAMCLPAAAGATSPVQQTIHRSNAALPIAAPAALHTVQQTGKKTIKAAYPTSVKQLSKGVLVSNSDNQDDWFTFKAAKSGYLTLGCYGIGGYLSLYRGNKRLSGRVWISNYEGSTAQDYMKGTFFGVKKGVTYRLRMEPTYIPKQKYSLVVKNTAVREKSGKKKSKSSTIKRNQKRTGYIAAGENKADYYKLKTNRKKLVLRFDGGTNEALRLKLTHKSGRVKVSRTMTLNRLNGHKYTATAKGSGNAVKGTWYLKVYRYNKTSSGFYTLKWK